MKFKKIRLSSTTQNTCRSCRKNEWREKSLSWGKYYRPGVKILNLLLYGLPAIIISALTGVAKAQQTGPLIKIHERFEPFRWLFNQPDLGGDRDPQVALIGRVIAIINIFLGFLAIIFIVLILYGGYLWLTAAGNEQRVEEAQNVLKQAIIGVIIILSAGVITNTVLTEILKATA